MGVVQLRLIKTRRYLPEIDGKGGAGALFASEGWQDSQLDGRRQRGGTIDPLLSLLEIGFRCLVDIKELLWIEVNDRKPAALDLHHDAMATTKGVKRIRRCKLDASRLAWDERFRPVEAVAKLAAHDFAPHQLLIAAQRVLYIPFPVGK